MSKQEVKNHSYLQASYLFWKVLMLKEHSHHSANYSLYQIAKLSYAQFSAWNQCMLKNSIFLIEEKHLVLSIIFICLYRNIHHYFLQSSDLNAFVKNKGGGGNGEIKALTYAEKIANNLHKQLPVFRAPFGCNKP